jgi:integrase
MTGAGRAEVTAAAKRLDDLAAELDLRGFAARVLTVGGKLQVRVQNRSISQLSDTVYAAPAADGSWWLWWSWADQLAPIEGDGPVKYTAHELRHVCASLLIASGTTDMQVTSQMGHSQMGHSKIETTKNISITPPQPRGHRNGRPHGRHLRQGWRSPVRQKARWNISGGPSAVQMTQAATERSSASYLTRLEEHQLDPLWQDPELRALGP